MKVIPGHEDLLPKKVVGLDLSRGVHLLVQKGEEVSRYEISVGPGGNLVANPYQEPVQEDTADQIGERKSVPVAARWAGVDQA